MKSLFALAALGAVLASWSPSEVLAPEVASPRTSANAAGLVVAVGGGGTPEAVFARVAKLAGGADARVLVLPQASEVNDGEGSAVIWREQGAGEATVLSDLGAEDARERIARAHVLWIPGGSQSRLMERLEEHGLVEAVRAAHARGAIVGGTSAGAAVVSKVMIAGAPDPGALRGGAMEALEGLGFVPWAIVDQHFVERDRLARLLTAVLDHPTLVGIGISEGTAALIDGSTIEVMGRGQVLVYDARAAEVMTTERGAHQSARGVTLHVVKPGESLRLPEPPKPTPR